MLKFSKSAQCGRRYKGEIKRIDRDEEDLQKPVNQMLTDVGIGYWRINSGRKIKELKGFPDNLCMIKISDEYCLMKGIELKTKSKTHGKQDQTKFDYSHSIAQTEAQVADIIEAFIAQAHKCKGCLKKD